MKINQVHAIVTTVTKEVLGETIVLQEDLSNVVDLGKAIINTDNIDAYVKSLVNHIGKVVFVDRLYAGGAPSVVMDSWEYGSILEKITAEMPTATENQSWELVDGAVYDPNIFYQPKVSAKFFNSKVTFEIQMSFTEMQVKQSFSNEAQLNGFISMLTTSIENAMTVKLDGLVSRTINNMAAETLSTPNAVRAVNLLALFNAGRALEAAITAEEAVSHPEFIRFASYQIALYSDRMTRISTLFNDEGKERFTPKDKLHIILLSDFAKASDVFLQSDVYNKDLISLPNHETVPYWQGSGTGYEFNEVSRINVVTQSAATVNQAGILGVMFDREALGVTNLNRRVTTNYNPKAEFYTNFYKFDAGYFNDLGENFVVFYVA
jgi:hypothetical protein